MVHANESKCVSFRGVAKQITDNLAQHLHFISEKMETQRKAVCPKTWSEVPADTGLEPESHVSVHCWEEIQLGFSRTSH